MDAREKLARSIRQTTDDGKDAERDLAKEYLPPDDPAGIEAYRIIDANLKHSVWDGRSFLWYGWALRAAFWAGVSWARRNDKEKQDE